VCTYINHRTEISGSGKGAAGWFAIRSAVIGFDHPVNAQLGHAVLIDFQNTDMDGGRIALELDIRSATALAEQLQKTIAEAVHSGLAE
jgi:hypothetical protein